MKNLFIILGFELGNYLKNKAYMLMTILVGVLAIAAMFLPHVIDLFGEDTSDIQVTMALCDPDETISDELLASFFPDCTFQRVDEPALKEKVGQQQVDAGFLVTSPKSFEYVVYNKGMWDSEQEIFRSLMQTEAFRHYCEVNNLNYAELAGTLGTEISSTETVLGKDSTQNYWYCYALVIVVFMLIVLYGVMIATSVTVEKSNRSIEVLVTSTSSSSLLFGKVIAGAIASILQCGFLLGGLLLSYRINQEAWGHRLDFLLDIPAEVLLTFAFFGLFGFLFYAFLYGMMGALVSKTEDINKTTGNVQMVLMVVYFLVLFQIQSPDGIVIKIASYLPISSYSAMFIRIAMGTVSAWEVILSGVILVASTIGVGILGAKIYRNSTLRYGNPIKIRHALKGLKQS